MTQLSTKVTRGSILRLQDKMLALPDAVKCAGTVEHFFEPGMYCRGIFLPKGIVVVGKIHLHAHYNYVSEGHCKVATEFGVHELRGPVGFYSEPGTKRAVLALEDTVWITYHDNPTNTRDLAELEATIIAPDYAALDQYIQGRLT